MGKAKAGILPCIPINLNIKDDHRLGALKNAQKILDELDEAMRVEEVSMAEKTFRHTHPTEQLLETSFLNNQDPKKWMKRQFPCTVVSNVFSGCRKNRDWRLGMTCT